MCSLEVNRRWIEINPNRENIRLIYLNNDEINNDIQFNLLQLNPSALFYTNIQLCIDYLKSVRNEKILLIICNSDILNSIHYFSSIIAIFIYNHHQEMNELKMKYPKIIDSCANLNDLIKSLQEYIQSNEAQFFIYSLFNQKNKLTNSLIWYKMLADILKQMKPQTQSERNELLSKCLDYHRNNPNELNKIQLFRQNYSPEQVIQWYINESFLYKLLNRALYTKDMEYLYLFRFFIIDLSFAIEKACENMKKQGDFIVYSSQLISNKEIEKFKKNIGCLISTNNFILTSRDKNMLLSNANVLFEIHVDLSMERISLVDISSTYVLFNINSLFQIDSVEYNSLNNLWQIKMSVSNEEINYLKWIEKEMDYDNPMLYFGHLLSNELGELNQAKNYFQILLKSLPNDDINVPKIYIKLGNINDEIGEYNLALKNYQYALDIYQKDISKDYIHIASVLHMIGIVYKHMGNFDQAMNYYQRSLDKYKNKCLNEKNYSQRADVLMNMGLVCGDKNDFDMALTYFTQSCDIRRDTLPNDHPLLANSLNNIGNIYHDKNNSDEALNYYQQAVSIEEISSSEDDLNKANTIRNMGLIYRDKQDWLNALNYFHRTLEIRQHLFSNINHPDIAICYGDIGTIHEKMNNLDLALANYQQQYQIEEQCLSINHPNLLIHFDWIINILKKQDQSEKAIEFSQEKLQHLKTILPNSYENHPHHARLLILIASIHEDKNPRQADQYYQQALTVLEYNKTEDIFPKCLSTMTNFYWKCRMFDRALICQMKLLQLRRTTLSSNHNDIAYTLRDLARLYRAMDKTTEALEYFNQSLNILQTNYGSEHPDVKNIQTEISDIQDIIKSISSSANEDYNNRRSSNAHKQLLMLPSNNSRSRSSSPSSDKSSTFISKSTACMIL